MAPVSGIFPPCVARFCGGTTTVRIPTEGAPRGRRSGRLREERLLRIVGAMETTSTPARATVGTGDGAVAKLSLAGDWTLAAPLPKIDAVIGEIAGLGAMPKLAVDASGLGRWDSVLPAFLFELANVARAKGAEL